MTAVQSVTDAYNDFLNAMAFKGVKPLDAITFDGKIRRFRVEGDKKGTKNGWAVFYAEHPISGAFGSYKLGINDTWTVERPERMSPADRDALKRKMEDARRQREAEQVAIWEATKLAAAQIWAATEPADPNHAYIIRKGITPPPGLRMLKHDVRYEVRDDEKPRRTTKAGNLVIPIFGPDKTLWSVQTIAPDGTKYYLFGTNKQGHYWSVGKLTPRVIIAEGYATAVSIHMATGCCVVVAFDSGNLKPVAEAIRKKFPQAEIVIAADNDRFTTKPVDNPGLTYARRAAEAIGAGCVFPAFPDEDPASTDFNDLHVTLGLDEVRFTFDPHLRPAAPAEPEDAPPPAEYDGPDAPPDNVVDLAEARAAREPAKADPPKSDGPKPRAVMPGGAHAPIPLGFDGSGTGGTTYYYMSATTHMITALNPPQHNEAYFVSMAPLEYWDMEFPGKKGADWSAARNAMISACSAAGYYKNGRVVGRGVSIDRGRVVLHLGNKLIVDGKRAPTMNLDDSELIYERGADIELQPCSPLGAGEGQKLIDVIGELPWTTSDMAPLFAGWLVVAPLCGILRWRPHMGITGQMGSGKSYITDKAIQILGDMAISYDGGTTEAALRQKIGRDALPVIFDEAESQNERAAERIQAILDLARAASTEKGAKVLKGGQTGRATEYWIRSCFLFSSINPVATQAADESRIIQLSLEGGRTDDETPERKAEREEHFRYIERKFAEILTPKFGSQLFARGLKLVHTIRANWQAFRSAIAAKSGNARMADTAAAPLAGWWALLSEEELTPERARAILDEHGWALSAAERQRTAADHDRAMSHLLDQKVRVNATREDNVSGLILRAAIPHPDCKPGERLVTIDLEARDALERLGIKVTPGAVDPSGHAGDVYFGSSHAGLSALFRGTPWAEGRWASVLKQHPFCDNQNKQLRFNGVNRKCFRFDVAAIVGRD